MGIRRVDPTTVRANGISRLDHIMGRKLYTDADRWFLQSRRLKVKDGALTRPFAQNGWAHAAMRVKATNLAMAPLVFKVGDRRKPGDAVLLADSDPLWGVFGRPHESLTACDLISGTSIFLDESGECFWHLKGENEVPHSAGTPPVEIHFIHPSEMKAVVVDGKLARWKRTSREGFTGFLDLEEVVHIKEWSPYSAHRGLSPLHAGGVDMRLDRKVGLANESIIDNGCDAGGVLSTDQDINSEQASEMETRWEEKFGDRNRGRIAVLGRGAKYQQTDVDGRKLNWMEQREWARAQILALIGTPKFLLSLIEDVNRNTAKESLRVLWEHFLIPRGIRICDAINHRILRGYRPNGSAMSIWAEFDTSGVEALQRDFNEKVESANGLKEVGYALNEINERMGLGMESVSWGDEPLVPNTMVPVSYALDGPADPAPEPEPKDDDKGFEARAWERGRLQRLRKYERQFFHPNERRMLAGTRRYLREMRVAVVEQIKQWRKDQKTSPPFRESDVSEILPEPGEWRDAMRGATKIPLEKIVRSALRALEDELGGFDVVDIADPRFMSRAEKELGRLVKLAAADRRKLGAVLRKAIKEGGITDVAGVEAAVRKFFGTAERGRALTIARTETGIVGSGVRYDAMRREGVKSQEWITAGDADVRPAGKPKGADHAVLHGQIREVGKTFSNGLRHPLDAGGPAEQTVNCRCVAFAVEE